MPTVRLAISGLKDGLDIIWPLMPVIASAFEPFGVNLQVEAGTVLAQDPEEQIDGWRNLVPRLEGQSQMSAPAHMVVTNAPPGFDRTIDGMLLDTSVRGVVAVYMDAYIYGDKGPVQCPDLVTQVCVHEIGHLLNLTHTDAGNPDVEYVSAMLPASLRQNQDLAIAWDKAIADAKSRGEPLLHRPSALVYLPFNAQCRACLRAATTDIRWLPFRGPFRGEFEGDGSNQDRLPFHLEAIPHREAEGCLVGAVLYFTLVIENRSTHKLDLPANISPAHGSLRVTVTHESGERIRHRASQALCSSARITLMPGERVHRSFALAGRANQELFAAPGRHRCRIELLDIHRPVPAVLGSSVLDVVVQGNADQTVAHLPLAHALSLRSSYERRKALSGFLAAHVPTRLRHVAARHLALERLRQGEAPREIAQEMRVVFADPLHDEVHDAIRRMGEGWKAHYDRLTPR